MVKLVNTAPAMRSQKLKTPIDLVSTPVACTIRPASEYTTTDRSPPRMDTAASRALVFTARPVGSSRERPDMRDQPHGDHDETAKYKLRDYFGNALKS